jgi:hypothetical protein
MTPHTTHPDSSANTDSDWRSAGWLEQLTVENAAGGNPAHRVITTIALDALTNSHTNPDADGPFDKLTADQLSQLLWLHTPFTTWHTSNLEMHAALRAAVTTHAAAIEQHLMASAHPHLQVTIGADADRHHSRRARTVTATTDELIHILNGTLTSRDLVDRLARRAIVTKRRVITTWSHTWQPPHHTCGPRAAPPAADWRDTEAYSRLTDSWTDDTARWVAELRQTATYLSGRAVLVRGAATSFAGVHKHSGQALTYCGRGTARLVSGRLAYAGISAYRTHIRRHLTQLTTDNSGYEPWRDLTGIDVSDLTEEQQATALLLACDDATLDDAVATATTLF